MPQNPSPMVEHRRAHPRIKEQTPPGRRENLSSGTLFIPHRVRVRRGIPLLFFFHGGKWLPEVAAARRGMAVVTMQIGSGSGIYDRAFATPGTFDKLLAEVRGRLGVEPGRITLGGWSAGCGAIRAILRDDAAYSRVASILAIDGIHADYRTGKPGPLESDIDPRNLEIWRKLAQDAIAGRKSFMLTHSEIFPGTFVSTTESADWLLRELNLKPRPVLRWGPMGSQQLSEARAGKFELRGYAGNTAPDHVDQLHSLADYLKRLK